MELSLKSRLNAVADGILQRYDSKPCPGALMEFKAIVTTDRDLLMQIFNITDAEFERRLLAHLMSRVFATTPRPVVPHQRRQSVPEPEKIRQRLAAVHSVAVTSARRVIMSIDGRDLREWTIGQALTFAKRKGHEAYVLRVIGNQLRHLDHTQEIGAILSDSDLQKIVAQGKESARDLG